MANILAVAGPNSQYQVARRETSRVLARSLARDYCPDHLPCQPVQSGRSDVRDEQQWQVV